MTRNNSGMLAVAAGLLSVSPALAQENKEQPRHSMYKVEFNIRDGSTATSSRRYAMLVDTDGKSTLRIGNKVPYGAGSAQTAQGPGSMQIQYADIGVDIDCRVREFGPRVSLMTELEISSVTHFDRAPAGGVPTPTVAAARVNVTTDVEPSKPVVIATIDDPVTQRKLDIEATATRVP